jgi:hypothetical protein
MDVIAVSSGLTINLPDATLAGPGQDVFFNNPGSNTFTVQDSGGNVIATVSAGQQKYLYLSDNSTSNGTWRVTLFGVGASAPDASALVGYGLKAIGATLNQSATTSTISANTTFGVSDRAKVFVNTGGAITCTLPLTSTASNDFFLELRNQGTGTVTVAPIGGETVDGSASVVLQVNESCFLHAGTGAWYTVGRGRNTSFNFTQLLKTVTGGTTTLSLTEASNVVQTYSGTATSPNVIVIPSVVQVYYISNQVLGGFNFTIQSPTPGSTLVLPYGQNAVVFCDGVNVINASTSVAGITALLLAAGSVSTPSLAISASGNGLYAPTSSTIAVTAGGVASVTFSGNGVNGRLGGDTPAAAAVTTLSASGAVSGAGVTALMASPTPIGSTTPSTGAFTTLSASGAATVGGGLAVTGTLSATGALTTASLKEDAAGNLGLGVTPSAWHITSKVHQIGASGYAALENYSGLAATLYSNQYRNTSNQQVAIQAGQASSYAQSAGKHYWSTNSGLTAATVFTPTTAMMLDAGSLKLFSTNTTSVNTKLIAGSGNDGVVGVVVVNTANQACPALNLSNWMGGVTSTGPYISFDNSTFGGWNVGSGNATNSFDICTTWGTPLVRVDSSGNLLVGATTAGNTVNADSSQLGKGTAVITHTNGTASGASYGYFSYNGAVIGSITQSGTTAVLYNTTSDYRLKTVIGPVTGHGARIDRLNPVNYAWNSDASVTCGFLAHQFQEVYAGSVSGAKDAVDADGNPIYQAMQAGSSEVIADLVAEIKSLRARLTAAGI